MKYAVYAGIQSGQVGIWWALNNEIFGDSVTLDAGFNDGSFIHYSDTKNHLTEWKRCVSSYVSDDPDSIIRRGYKSLERGRVVFNLRTQVYEIVCSEAASKDADLLQAVKSFFQISGRCDVIVDTHYHLAELTGNLALDQFEYGV